MYNCITNLSHFVIDTVNSYLSTKNGPGRYH